MGEEITGERDDDAALLAAWVEAIATSQDRDAFRRLYETLAPAVKALALRQGADSAVAEDLTQETFLSVWRKAQLYSPARGAVRSWVFAIARNLRIDRLRRTPAWQELTDEQFALPAAEPLADEAIDARYIQSRVRAVLATLPPEQAMVVTLAFLDGLSHTEIAAKLHTPLGTVKTRMNSAYAKMRAALRDLK